MTAQARVISDRLGELLADERGTAILAELQKLHLATSPPTAPLEPTPDEHVGIWRWDHDGGATIRHDVDSDERRLWSDAAHIAPKTDKVRIVVLGESAARGYLFEPHLTFAKQLASAVDVIGERRWDVVDLAKTGLARVELLGLVASIHLAKPDVLVVFAGNNWENEPLSLEDCDAAASTLKRHGYPAVRRQFVDHVIRERAETTVLAVAERARQLGVPVVWVVPEFNLRDWRQEPSVMVPMLPGDKVSRWLDLWSRAEAARVAGDWRAVTACAQEMRKLDECSSSQSAELLAEGALDRGDLATARLEFERARDAVAGLPVKHAPRCPKAVQDTIRAAAADGFQVVDTPSLLRGSSSHAIPGSEFFMDYCHMSARGLAVIAAETALAIAGVTRSRLTERATIAVRATPPGIGRDAEALSHILAAIHNAHFGQRSGVLRYHCDRAISLSSEAFNNLGRLLEVLSLSGPLWTSDAYEALSRRSSFDRYVSGGTARDLGRFADFDLRRAVADALEPLPGGPDLVRRAADTLRSRFERETEQDLLDPCLGARTLVERTGHSLNPDQPVYRTLTGPHSYFWFVIYEEVRVWCRLELVVRSTNSPDGALLLSLNHQDVGRVALSRSWSTTHIALPAPQVGPNRICLSWSGTYDSQAPTEAAVLSLRRGAMPEVLPSLVDIWRLRLVREKSA